MIQKLLDLGADPNKGRDDNSPIDNLIWRFGSAISPHFGYRSDSKIEGSMITITKFADRGGRWQPQNNNQVNSLRRHLYKLDGNWIQKIIKAFKKHQVCSDELLLKLVNTPRMKEILGDQYLKLRDSLK
jgi:hypothetical protein